MHLSQDSQNAAQNTRPGMGHPFAPRNQGQIDPKPLSRKGEKRRRKATKSFIKRWPPFKVCRQPQPASSHPPSPSIVHLFGRSTPERK